MTDSGWLHKGKTFCFVILLITLTAFAADIFDLREELNILPSAYSCLDSNITTGIANNLPFEPEPVLTSYSDHGNASIGINVLHLPPCGFRAPPSRA